MVDVARPRRAHRARLQPCAVRRLELREAVADRRAIVACAMGLAQHPSRWRIPLSFGSVFGHGGLKDPAGAFRAGSRMKSLFVQLARFNIGHICKARLGHRCHARRCGSGMPLPDEAALFPWRWPNEASMASPQRVAPRQGRLPTLPRRARRPAQQAARTSVRARATKPRERATLVRLGTRARAGPLAATAGGVTRWGFGARAATPGVGRTRLVAWASATR